MKNVKRALALVLVSLFVLTCFAACGKSPEKAILGAWRDSTGSFGYEFKEGNTCVVTYMEDMIVPVIGTKINGSFDGIYTIEEAEDGTCYVTITYTIYSKSLTKKFMFKIDGSALTLTDMEDQTQTTLIAYQEQTTAAETTSAPVSQ